MSRCEMLSLFWISNGVSPSFSKSSARLHTSWFRLFWFLQRDLDARRDFDAGRSTEGKEAVELCSDIFGESLSLTV